MKRGLVTLNEIIPHCNFPGVLHGVEARTIRPPPKVIGDPTREPVNKQAAMLIARAGWMSKPLPPETLPRGEVERLREENSKLKTINIGVIAENSILLKRIAKLNKVLAFNKPNTTTIAPRPKLENIKKTETLERLKKTT